MSDTTERGHLSIGEVLSLLQDEFPDITISKIRFLESQGLLDPERTPSGYRKFYEADIDRLRWILRQQKDNFLPLKVIKDRLASGELDGPATEPSKPAGKAPATKATASAPAKPTTKAAAKPRAKANSTQPLLDTGETAVSMTLDELVAATGLTNRAIGDLERFGLINSRALGDSTYYDEDALVAARLASAFLRHGVEPRHLRMYKVAAEREAGVFEQLVMPLLKQRNPSSRGQALEMLQELADLGGQLRAAMLRQALREYLGKG